jgi:hypothetical protein
VSALRASVFGSESPFPPNFAHEFRRRWTCPPRTLPVGEPTFTCEGCPP